MLVVPWCFKLVVPRRIGLVVPRCLSLIVPALISLFIPHSFMVVIPGRTMRWSLVVKKPGYWTIKIKNATETIYLLKKHSLSATCTGERTFQIQDLNNCSFRERTGKDQTEAKALVLVLLVHSESMMVDKLKYNLYLAFSWAQNE